MTREEREEAINIMSQMIKDEEGFLSDNTVKAHKIAIKALEQEPCADAVSRQAVKEQMIKYGFHAPDMTVTEFVKDLPPVTPTCEEREKESVYIMQDELISRQAVIDIVDSYSESQSNVEDVTQDIISDISALPPATPQPKTGQWIVHEKPYGIRYLECPHCNIWYLNEHLIRNSYCPNCGAKMVEPQERSEE